MYSTAHFVAFVVPKGGALHDAAFTALKVEAVRPNIPDILDRIKNVALRTRGRWNPLDFTDTTGRQYTLFVFSAIVAGIVFSLIYCNVCKLFQWFI